MFKAGKTHKVGKSGHSGDDGATPAVVAPEWRPTSDGFGRAAVVVVVVVFVHGGTDGRGRAKVPDGLPRVRGRGESVRRPSGRRGRRHQETAHVAPGLVRGQNEICRGRGHRATAAAAAASTTAATALRVAAAATVRPVDIQRRCPTAAVAARPPESAAVAAAGRPSPDQRVHRSTRPVARARRRRALGILRRAGRVIDQFVGRRRSRRRSGSRRRCLLQASAVGLLDEKTGGGVQQQETVGRHTGKRCSYKRRRGLVFTQDVGGYSCV